MACFALHTSEKDLLLDKGYKDCMKTTVCSGAVPHAANMYFVRILLGSLLSFRSSIVNKMKVWDGTPFAAVLPEMKL